MVGGVKKNHIILNQNLIDPAKIISGDINSEAIQWIRANSHRYLGKYTGEGQMTICQLSDDNNGGKTDAVYFADTNYTYINNVENDSRCDWFMRLPKFYYHAEEVEPDIWDIGFGQEPEADDWKCWDGNDLIGCFKAFVNDGRLLSWEGVKPTVSISQSDFKAYAHARGTGYSLVKWKHHSMMAFLFYAMYGNTDSQDICGDGTSTSTKSTGRTSGLGMTDTVAGGNGDLDSINFWGLEDWWGWRYEWIDNVSSQNGSWTIEEDDGSIRKIHAFLDELIACIYKVYVGEFLDMIPTLSIDSSMVAFCDEQGCKNDSMVYPAIRSGNMNSRAAGVAYVSVRDEGSLTHSSFSTRLAFRGDIIVENDVPTFRSIPITNVGGDSPVSP